LFAEEPLLAFALVFHLFFFWLLQVCHLKCQMLKTLDEMDHFSMTYHTKVFSPLNRSTLSDFPYFSDP